MFDETKKYKNNGHFFFRKGNNLELVSKEVPELPGVYYIFRLARGSVDLVYTGKSGITKQGIHSNASLLKQTINGQQEFLDGKMSKGDIDGLDIYWFVTIDAVHHDLPAYVEGLILQRIFDVQGRLPEWNE